MLPSGRTPAERRQGVGSRNRPTSMIEPGFSVASIATSEPTTSKQAKRRSLLPQLSRNSPIEERALGEATCDVQSPSQGEDLGDVGKDDERQATDASSMPPPPTIPRRQLSIRAPTRNQFGGGAATQARAPSPSKEHVVAPKAISNGTAASSRNTTVDSGLKRSSSIRAPQPTNVRGGLTRSGSVQVSRSHVRNGSIVSNASTATGSKRGSVSFARPLPPNTSPPGSLKSVTLPTSPSKAENNRYNAHPGLQAPSKPAFNTYQQHYSPAKSSLPKPPIPTSKATKVSASGEGEGVIDAETGKLQTELAQLSMLHETALQTLAEYDASAQVHLGRLHAAMTKELQVVSQAEQERGKFANLQALQAWCCDEMHLVDSLQTLGRTHQEVGAMADYNSGYAQMMTDFGQWVAEAEDCVAQRTPHLLEALPESWRHAHASMALRLRSSQRDLASLPAAQQPSSLASIITACDSLVNGLLRELDMMTKLEREILKQNRTQIDEEVASLGAGYIESISAREWVPLWQQGS